MENDSDSKLSGFNYDRIKETPDSVFRNHSKFVQRNHPWTIQNLLPSRFNLYYQPQFSTKTEFLGKIESQEKKTFPPSKFTDGGKLIVMYPWIRQNGLQEETLAMPPHVFQSQWKNIKIGDVVYRSWDGGRQYFTSYADFSGIMLHNELMFPLNVYYKGNLVGQLGARDGMTYLGGSGASLYFDNDRDGLNIGDKLTFGYSMPGNSSLMFTVTLNDNHAYHVYVGKISVGEPELMPDRYAYNVNTPTVTGYTYYIPIGRYNSVPTDPYAPI